MIHIGDAERYLFYTCIFFQTSFSRQYRIRDDGIIFQSRFKSAPIFIEMYHEMQHVFQAVRFYDCRPLRTHLQSALLTRNRCLSLIHFLIYL